MQNLSHLTPTTSLQPNSPSHPTCKTSPTSHTTTSLQPNSPSHPTCRTSPTSHIQPVFNQIPPSTLHAEAFPPHIYNQSSTKFPLPPYMQNLSHLTHTTSLQPNSPSCPICRTSPTSHLQPVFNQIPPPTLHADPLPPHTYNQSSTKFPLPPYMQTLSHLTPTTSLQLNSPSHPTCRPSPTSHLQPVFN